MELVPQGLRGPEAQGEGVRKVRELTCVLAYSRRDQRKRLAHRSIQPLKRKKGNCVREGGIVFSRGGCFLSALTQERGTESGAQHERKLSAPFTTGARDELSPYATLVFASLRKESLTQGGPYAQHLVSVPEVR